MPRTMKAAVYYRNADIRVEERPVPRIGPGELLVKVVTCGLCSGEAMEWYHVPRAPKVMGHEAGGVVAEVGAGVTRFKEGDRVFVNHHVGRMQSPEALRGHFTRDPYYSKSHLDPGAMCEYYRAPKENVEADAHRLPDRISFEDAAVIEPWACVLGGLKVAGIKPGDTVAVLGAGFMGQGFVHMAPLFGAGRVIALDFSDWRLKKALELGADEIINPRTEKAKEKLFDLNQGRGADAVVVTVPSVTALEAAYELVGTGGTLHLNAPPPGTERWSLNPEHLYFSEITITTKYSADHRDTAQLISFLSSGKVRPGPAITHRFPLEGAQEAMNLLVKAGESLKSIIYPGGLPAEEG